MKLITAFALFMGLSAHFVARADDSLVDDLTFNLYGMKAIYRAEYAPAAWKKQFANYDLDTEFTKALTATQGRDPFTILDARGVLKNFIYAMRDYHTSIFFTATEAASLPFTVVGADGRYFLAFIDRTKLAEDNFPFHEGDELVSFGGKATVDAVLDVKNEFIENVAATDLGLAAARLTKRSATRGMAVPQGPITLGIKAKGSDSVKEIQLVWDYTPEQISPRGKLSSSALSPLFSEVAEKSTIFRPQMDVKLTDLPSGENPFDVGARKTFTPALGVKVWESADSDLFHAYIYKTPDRKLIGYVRIASYGMADYHKAIDEFTKIVARFESTTDAMIIDQVNNPGGSVFYLYTLASLLTDKPLVTPLHRMSITQADVAAALGEIERLKAVRSDDDAKKFFVGDEDLHGYPASYEVARFQLNYAKFLVSEWNAGRKLSNPYWIGGVDHINPNPNAHYSKPILLLTNHLDFSGGDFFPTILQDNKRVTVMGSRTAGAGGYVNDISIPNNIGVTNIRCTESIAERVSGNPIENLGVTPDIAYEMTAEDYTNNFAPYVKAIQDAVANLTK